MDEKATQLHAIASLKVLLDATKPQDGANGNATGVEPGGPGGAGAQGSGAGAIGVEAAHDSGRASQGTEVSLCPTRSFFETERKKEKFSLFLSFIHCQYSGLRL